MKHKNERWFQRKKTVQLKTNAKKPNKTQHNQSSASGDLWAVVINTCDMYIYALFKVALVNITKEEYSMEQDQLWRAPLV